MLRRRILLKRTLSIPGRKLNALRLLKKNSRTKDIKQAAIKTIDFGGELKNINKFPLGLNCRPTGVRLRISNLEDNDSFQHGS